MTGNKKPSYYWDSCIYIGWLNQEDHIWMPAVHEILAKNFEGNNRIYTSTITLVEVLERVDESKEAAFWKLFSPGEHEIHDVDIRIAEKARKLRSHFNVLNPKIRLAVPDAIHLATALSLKVGEFHTNDNGNRKDEHGRKTVPVLKLSGQDLAGESLSICQPSTPQFLLPFKQ